MTKGLAFHGIPPAENLITGVDAGVRGTVASDLLFGFAAYQVFIGMK